MAGELQIRHTTGATGVYAMVFDATGNVWATDSSAFETYATVDITDYDIAFTELGTASQIFTATFPSAIAAGTYRIFVKDGSGTAAEADTYVTDFLVEWDGTKIVSRSSWASVSVVDVGEGREWTVERDGRVAPTIVIAATDSVTLSMDFGRFLNNETSLSTADSVVDQSGNVLTTSNVVLSGDKRKIFFDVAAADLAASTTYKLRCTGTTTDGNTISADGPLKTRA